MPSAQRLGAEFFGTFWLVFGGCGSAVLAAAFPDVGIGLLGNLIAGPAIGALSDRFGARRMTLISVIALAGVLAAFSLVQNVYQLYAVALLLVLLGAGTGPVTFTRIIAGWFNERRGLALGFALTGIGLGGAIAPPVSQALISEFGWLACLLTLGVCVGTGLRCVVRKTYADDSTACLIAMVVLW